MINLPNIPSFFKKIQPAKFNFQPRYYNKKDEKKKILNFKRIHDSKSLKGRNKRIIFIIIVLSLLAYYFLK